jgi:hypothetical protein
MASTYTSLDEDDPNVVVPAARSKNGIGTSLSFPAENNPLPFYTKISIQQYDRKNPNNDPTSQVISRIYLPLPTQLIDTQSVNTDNKELGPGYGTLGGAFEEWIKAEFSFGGGVKAIMERFEPSEASRILATLSAIFRGNASDATKGFAGGIANPHLTTVFQGVNLKTFNLSWKLSPRSPSESSTLASIIKTLKQAQLPDQKPDSFFMDYPWEMLVEFRPAVQKVRRSFLKTLTVNYTAAGQPSFFDDEASTDIELALELQELEIALRRDV